MSVEDAGCLFDLGFQAQVRVLSLDVGTAGRLQLRHALIGAAHVHVACLRTCVPCHQQSHCRGTVT
jgi:hypothetical protein